MGLLNILNLCSVFLQGHHFLVPNPIVDFDYIINQFICILKFYFHLNF